MGGDLYPSWAGSCDKTQAFGSDHENLHISEGCFVRVRGEQLVLILWVDRHVNISVRISSFFFSATILFEEVIK